MDHDRTLVQESENLVPQRSLDEHMDNMVNMIRAWPIWEQTMMGPILPEHMDDSVSDQAASSLLEV